MNTTITDIRPRMRTGIFFTPTAEGDGVLLANGSEIVTFHGASTYAWLEKLSPHLDGRHSVSDLTASLPPGPRRMVEKLVGALYEAGLVRDVSQDEPHSLTPQELERYASEIAFIEAFRTSPGLRFQRYRRTPAVLIGSGAVFTAAAEAALLTGIGRLSVRPTAVPETGVAEHPDGAAGPHRDTAPLDASDPADLRAAVEGAELVLYAADRADPDVLRSLDRLCAGLGRTFVAVTVDADEAWIGPVCSPDRAAARWESLWLRLGTGADAVPGGTGFLTGPVPGILANHLVFRAFEHLTGVAEAPEGPGGSAVRLDLETLQTSVHTIAPHPSADRTSDTGGHRPAPEAAAVEAAELAERVAPLTDERLGVLGPVSEGHFEQFPLRVVRVAVNDPHEPGAPTAVCGAGPDFAHAQDAALRLGLASYAVRGGAAGTGTGTATGISLADGAAVPVPVDEVFEPSPGPSAVLPVGTAGAAGWNEAVEQGLLAHVLSLTPAEPPAGTTGLLPFEELELSAAAGRFLDLLRASGEEVAARTVPAPAGVHVIAFRLGTGGTGPAERGAGFTEAEAVEAGLGRLLLAWQSRASGQAEYSPSTTVSLRTSFGPGTAAGGDPGTRGREPRHGALVAALRTLGHAAVAVPLDHDPALRAVLPHLVRVVLRDV
ncbi:hypothetical protein ACQKM2_20160 [Streptomyces sp. NPDC004126]|uniref:hypothetical protein n=1 Tax=Streptomyces sp. NPDC004126 TaxID=3390695 RepID=UPI003D0500BD